MNDTHPEIKRKQLEFHLSLPLHKRWECGFEMMENGRDTVIASISKNNPSFSDEDIFIEFVKVFYKNDFSPETLTDIENFVRLKSQIR